MADRTLFLSLMFMVLSLPGCNTFGEDPNDMVVARVGNQTLTLKTAIDRIPDLLLAQDTAEAVRLYQTGWIEEKILESEAIRLGLQNDPEVLKRVERMKSQLIRNSLKEVFLSRHQEELSVSVEEARNYYQANRERFILEERYVRFRHMTTQNRAAAEQARRAIMRGVPWQEVAREYSLEPDRQIRESERFVPVSMALPDIPVMQRYLDVIGRTEISPIQQHGGSFHFIQLMEDRPEGDNPDLDWLIEQIREWLYLEKAQRLFNSYKRNLYLQAEANNELDQLDISGIEESLVRDVLPNAEP